MLFNYIVSTPEGEQQTGTIEAVSSDVAVKSLQARNLIVVSVESAEKKNFFKINLNVSKLFGGIKSRDIAIFSRQLATLFSAKIPVLSSFKLLASDVENATLRETLNDIVIDIQGGTSMSQSMAKHPKIFSKFFVNIVRSGEETGKLDEAFSYMADYLERSYETISKVRNAMIYPAFVIVSLVAAVVVMMIYVIPQLTSTLIESGQEIPMMTQILIGASGFMRQYGIYILIVVVIGAVFLYRFSRTEKGKLAFSQFYLKLPILGVLYKKFYISRFTDNLETSLTSGVSAVRSLEIAAEVAGETIYGKILKEALVDVKAGGPISASLARYDEIPHIVSQMIRIGEESGKLNFILKTLSNFYRKEVDNAISTLVSLIEPALIIVLGVFICFFILAIIGPIYHMTDNF